MNYNLYIKSDMWLKKYFVFEQKIIAIHLAYPYNVIGFWMDSNFAVLAAKAKSNNKRAALFLCVLKSVQNPHWFPFNSMRNPAVCSGLTP